MAVLIGVGSAAQETAVGVVEGDVGAPTGAVLQAQGPGGSHAACNQPQNRDKT